MALCIRDCGYFGDIVETLGWVARCVRIVGKGEEKRLGRGWMSVEVECGSTYVGAGALELLERIVARGRLLDALWEQHAL